MHNPPCLWALGMSLAGTLLAAPAAAQQQSGAFVTLLGSDTIAAERYTHAGDRIVGREVIRTPRTTITDYMATLAADGTVSHVEVQSQRPGEPEPYQRATIEFGADSALVTTWRPDRTRSYRVAAPRGSIPWVSMSMALYEPALRWARSAGVDSAAVALVPPGSQSFAATLRRTGSRSFEVRHVAGAYRMEVDEQGRITAWDGTASTVQVLAERVPSLDLDFLAAAFLAREQANGAMGLLSPRDSVRATLGSASLVVDYGRPSRRGRRIFGNVVPWGKVWRAGANAATHLRTDRALVIGGVVVPAGTYTLWTLPSLAGWKLILNRQTGQWGIEYDPERDLVRVEMRVERLPEAVDQFTIAVEPEGDGGRLVLLWDDTRAWVPISTR
ncbi:MAG TPA: DUF2911 domain-containing protein [Longimicrobiaceae bacterium]|nr:DUF2911 domain-containing protein [Longimicrobiaceae bacterium]